MSIDGDFSPSVLAKHDHDEDVEIDGPSPDKV